MSVRKVKGRDRVVKVAVCEHGKPHSLLDSIHFAPLALSANPVLLHCRYLLLAESIHTASRYILVFVTF